MRTMMRIRFVLYAAALFCCSVVSWTTRTGFDFATIIPQQKENDHDSSWLISENKESHKDLLQKLEHLEEQLLFMRKQQHERPSEETNGTSILENNQKDHDLPSCRTLMQYPHSPWANGDFLTQRSHPVWTFRHDGSQALEEIAHICRLHRYTADEARQCLAHSVGHLNMIGDSIMRYQFLSLAQFVHEGHYPAHFPRGEPTCRHLDERGVPQCAPPDQPNLATQADWLSGMATHGWKDSWQWYHGAVGGGSDGDIFDGHMECNCARSLRMQCGEPLTAKLCATENELYVSPPIPKSMVDDGTEQRFILSNIQETGRAYRPTPIKGFNFTGCAFTGTCRRSHNLTQELLQRAEHNDFDFSQPLAAALYEDGVLRQHLPPVNVSIYNRGLWGALPRENSAKILPRLYNFTGREHGRCFYRSTTASPQSGEQKIRTIEDGYVRQDTFDAGCSFLDFARITQPFEHLKFQNQHLLRHKVQKGERRLSIAQERQSIYRDANHFQPWVYEELNNLLLNVLCNHAVS